MLKKFFAVFFVVAFIFSSVNTTFAETEIKNVIRVTGIGYGLKGANPNSSFYKSFAKQTAKLDALVQLAELINGINIENDENKYTTWIDEKASEKLIKNARQVGDSKFHADKEGEFRCEVTMELK